MDWIYGLLPENVWAWLAGAIPAGALVGGLYQLRERARKKAAGSTLTVYPYVDSNGIRRSTTELRAWTECPLDVVAIYVLWPPTAQGIFVKPSDAGYVYRDVDPSGARRWISISPAQQVDRDPIELVVALQVTNMMKKLPQPLARLHLLVLCDTHDAHRRRTVLHLRSQLVDWNKKPEPKR